MEYRNYNGTYYIRMDRGDEIISGIMEMCRKEGISSGIYSGIGGCSEAEIQIFIAEKGVFETERLEGTLELISLNGDIMCEPDGALWHHTHACFSYMKDGEEHLSAGHMKSITVLYTAEIEFRPVVGGTIGTKFDPETGTKLWNFA